MKQQNDNTPTKLYSIKEAAKLWNLSVWEVRGLIKNGKLRPIIGVGKGFKFDGSELKTNQLERL